MQSSETRHTKMPEFIGTSGASKLLGRSIKTVIRYVDSGKLTAAGRLRNGNANDAIILYYDEVVALAQQLKA